MIATTVSWLLAILTLFIIYLIYFLILKPLVTLKFYKNQGIKMDFFPLLGNVKGCIDALNTTGDFYGHWIRQIKENPHIRIFGGNFLDRPQLYLVDPQLIKEFYKNQDNYIKLPKIIDLIKIMTKDGLITSEGEEWKRHRKIIASAFHFDLLKDMVPDVVKIADQFLEDFKKKDLNSITLTQEFEGIAGEVIGRLFFGENFSDHRIQGKPVIYFLSDLANRIGTEGPTLLYMLFGIKVVEWGILPKYRRMVKDVRDLQNFASIIVEQKKKEGKKEGSRSLIDILLAQAQTNSEQALNTQEIINEFLTFVGAGSNTTGGAVGRAIYYLHQNPQYKQKLMEEINNHFSDPSKVTLDSLNQMDFMTAFIKETLRFSPPVIGLLDRQATRDHTLGDIKIAKGTAVNLGMLLNNFNPMYHDNADDFYPERWLTDSKTKESITKDAFVFVPFSSGARNCIGQHLAMNETRIILSLFLKKYDFVLDADYKHAMTQRIVYEPLNQMNFKLIAK